MALTALLMLLLSFLRSRHTIFWSDEVMGWLVLRERTFTQLLYSWWTGADSSGIFFYVLARPWLAIFGASELSLRLFSAAGVAAAAILLWVCARRFYSFGVVASLLPVTLLLHRTLLWQLANSRTYGLFLAAIALVALNFALTDPDRPLSRKLLLLAFAAHLLLVGSHILGPLYSGVFLGGLIARDLWFHVFRPQLYLAAAAGWLALLVSYRNLVATAALGKPSFWTLRPNNHDLWLGLTAGDERLHKACLLLLIIAATAFLTRRRIAGTTAIVARRSITPVTLIGTFFAAVLVLFAVSRVTTSVFVDRYLLPVLLGDALLLCELATRILADMEISGRVRQLLFFVLLLTLAQTVRHDLPLLPTEYPPLDYTGSLVKLIPPGVPAVITDPGIFAEMVFYHNRARTFITPLDWEIATSPENGLGAVSGEHEMQNWKQLGYYSNQIEPTEAILHNNPAFVVIADAASPLWFKWRVVQSGRYAITDLGLVPKGEAKLHLWLVHIN